MSEAISQWAGLALTNRQHQPQTEYAERNRQAASKQVRQKQILNAFSHFELDCPIGRSGSLPLAGLLE